jgi:hypothetical protein
VAANTRGVDHAPGALLDVAEASSPGATLRAVHAVEDPPADRGVDRVLPAVGRVDEAGPRTSPSARYFAFCADVADKIGGVLRGCPCGTMCAASQMPSIRLSSSRDFTVT